LNDNLRVFYVIKTLNTFLCKVRKEVVSLTAMLLKANSAAPVSDNDIFRRLCGIMFTAWTSNSILTRTRCSWAVFCV